MIDRLMSVYGKNSGIIVYDIGCAMSRTLASSTLDPMETQPAPDGVVVPWARAQLKVSSGLAPNVYLRYWRHRR